MANLFDDANAPETEPATIVAGDQVKWKRTDLGTDYPNTAYSLRYSSRLEGTGSTTFDVASADSGDNYLMTIAHGTTASLSTGVYHWQQLLQMKRPRWCSGGWCLTLRSRLRGRCGRRGVSCASAAAAKGLHEFLGLFSP